MKTLYDIAGGAPANKMSTPLSYSNLAASDHSRPSARLSLRSGTALNGVGLLSIIGLAGCSSLDNLDSGAISGSAAMAPVDNGGGSGTPPVDNGGGSTLTGNGANDTLVGGAGVDTLYGGDGDDRLIGDADDDTLTGGDGDDYLASGDDGGALNGGAATTR